MWHADRSIVGLQRKDGGRMGGWDVEVWGHCPSDADGESVLVDRLKVISIVVMVRSVHSLIKKSSTPESVSTHLNV